jgi:predicted GNAT family acetyltransferase
MNIAPDDIRKEQRINGGRYSYRFSDGSEAEMIYVADQPEVAIIAHTYTPPRHRGQGIAAQLVALAVSDFRREHRKVVPSCWFARQEFSKHPEWSDPLHRQ